MKPLPIIMLLFANAMAGAASAGEQRLDKSKDFAYTLPDGWKVVDAARGKHDTVVLQADDGKNRNIVINDQPGKSSLAELKRKYERDLPKALKNFQLIASELIELDGKREAIRIVHTNTTPGVPVRQVNYVLDVGGKRYFIACTALKEDGDKYDEVFTAFVSSMAEPEK
jgi:hypothetical protein